jgi:membrane-bound ClpP family serine protease
MRSSILKSFIAAGFIVPCILFLWMTVAHIQLEGTEWWLLILWPTSVLLILAEASWPHAKLIAFTIAALSNVLIYSAVGAVVALIPRR